jgi:DNA-binding MarR family transcriptional regulator
MSRFIDDYLLYLLAQASSRASSEFHAELARDGIAVWEWRILGSLYPSAEASVTELARSCLAKQPTMTRQIDRMAHKGLVERVAAESDRRRVTVRLTERGQAVAAGLTARARDHEERLLGSLGQAEAQRLKTALAGLVDEAGRD